MRRERTDKHDKANGRFLQFLRTHLTRQAMYATTLTIWTAPVTTVVTETQQYLLCALLSYVSLQTI